MTHAPTAYGAARVEPGTAGAGSRRRRIPRFGLAVGISGWLWATGAGIPVNAAATPGPVAVPSPPVPVASFTPTADGLPENRIVDVDGQPWVAVPPERYRRQLELAIEGRRAREGAYAMPGWQRLTLLGLALGLAGLETRRAWR